MREKNSYRFDFPYTDLDTARDNTSTNLSHITHIRSALRSRTILLHTSIRYNVLNSNDSSGHDPKIHKYLLIPIFPYP